MLDEANIELDEGAFGIHIGKNGVDKVGVLFDNIKITNNTGWTNIVKKASS